MASPKYEALFIVDNSGAPLTSATPAFTQYVDSSGSSLSQPSIVNKGNGQYAFVPNFPASPNLGVFYVIATGANPAYVSSYIRPEDYAVDLISTVAADAALARKTVANRMVIQTVGGDANKAIIYDDDGTTPLFKSALKDSTGAPSTSAVFERGQPS